MTNTISISNVSFFDKSQWEWSQNLGKGGFYELSGGSRLGSTFDDYLNLLKESIPQKIKTIAFKDEPLNADETNKLKTILESRIKELLEKRIIPTKGHASTINFLGKEIKIYSYPSEENQNDHMIGCYFKSYNICCECLKENKPVFLSIYNEDY